MSFKFSREHNCINCHMYLIPYINISIFSVKCPNCHTVNYIEIAECHDIYEDEDFYDVDVILTSRELSDEELKSLYRETDHRISPT